MKKIIITEQQLGKLMDKLKGKVLGGNKQPQVSDYDKTVEEFTKLSQDPSRKIGFANAFSLSQQLAIDKAQNESYNNLSLKINPTQTQGNLSINQGDIQNARVIGQELFKVLHDDGKEYYHCLMLVELD